MLPHLLNFPLIYFYSCTLSFVYEYALLSLSASAKGIPLHFFCIQSTLQVCVYNAYDGHITKYEAHSLVHILHNVFPRVMEQVLNQTIICILKQKRKETYTYLKYQVNKDWALSPFFTQSE